MCLDFLECAMTSWNVSWLLELMRRGFLGSVNAFWSVSWLAWVRQSFLECSPVHCGVRFYSSLDSPGACYADQPPQTGATGAAAVAKPATDQANNNRPGQHLKPRRRRFLLFYGPVVKRRQER